MESYQVPCFQRQHLNSFLGMITMVLTPKAPARWAMPVSTVTRPLRAFKWLAVLVQSCFQPSLGSGVQNLSSSTLNE